MPLTHTLVEEAASPVTRVAGSGKSARVVVWIYLIRACYTPFRFRGAVAVELGGSVEDLGQVEGLLEPMHSKENLCSWLGLRDEGIVLAVVSVYGALGRI